MRTSRFRSEHGPIRCTVRVGAENPAALDALRIVARLLVAQSRRNPPAGLPFDAKEALSVTGGVPA